MFTYTALDLTSPVTRKLALMCLQKGYPIQVEMKVAKNQSSAAMQDFLESQEYGLSMKAAYKKLRHDWRHAIFNGPSSEEY